MVLQKIIDLYFPTIQLLFQKIARPIQIEKWAVVNFSARCDIRGLIRDLVKCGGMKGIVSF